LSAAVLCGCGSAAGSAQPAETATASTPAAAKDKRQQFEAAKADCMKQKGFKYIPYVRPADDGKEAQALASGDYQAMREHRAKYGFEVFAVHAYPKEMGISDESGTDPNQEVIRALSPAQLDSYNAVKDDCVVVAGKQVLGLTLTSNMDYFNQRAKAQKQAKATELDGDPKLVELAGAMATCLKGKGYTVGDTKPTSMNGRGREVFLVQQDKLGRKQDPDVPDVAPPRKEGKGMGLHMPTLTPQEAKPYLAKEIKAALDDLECGKDFYAAYTPRESAVRQRVDDQFAF
jgi:hypothetical protein